MVGVRALARIEATLANRNPIADPVEGTIRRSVIRSPPKAHHPKM
jgi:hypothetical protein